MPQASHMSCIDVLISGQKGDFTCHKYVRFHAKVVGVDFAKRFSVHRLRYHQGEDGTPGGFHVRYWRCGLLLRIENGFHLRAL